MVTSPETAAPTSTPHPRPLRGFGTCRGCSTTADEDKRCATYADVYTLYLASTKVRPVSKEESAAGAAAAIFLRTYCGWTGKTTAPATKGVRGAKPEPEVDANDVPII